MTLLALDTSLAVPLLAESHPHHRAATRWWSGRPIGLTAHSMAETYAVLTRLPGDARVAPGDAARLLGARFDRVLSLAPDAMDALAGVLAEAEITGGATYDALVALAARHHDATLATSDARALPTYRALGVAVEVVPG